MGRSLKRMHCKGNLVPPRKQVAYKPFGTKGGLSGPKRVPRPLFKQHSRGGHRQHNSGCLYQRRGGDEVGPSVCPSVENPDLVYQETGNPQSLTHPRPDECDSRQAIQTRPNHSNRMVPSPRVLPSHLFLVANRSNLVTQPFNQTLYKYLSNLNLHAWLLRPQQSRSRASLRQWQHKFRLLKEDQPDLSMRQSGPFLQSGASIIRWTSGHHL